MGKERWAGAGTGFFGREAMRSPHMEKGKELEDPGPAVMVNKKNYQVLSHVIHCREKLCHYCRRKHFLIGIFNILKTE